jgi:protein Mpv17
VDLAQILQFMLFTAIIAAPNYIFQTVLEKCFPTMTVPKSLLQEAQAKHQKDAEELLRKHGQLDVRNTIIKFFLDQTLSATTNTMLFIIVLGLIKGQNLEYIRTAVLTVRNA